MANKKKDVYRPKPMTEGKKAVIQGLLDEYDIQSAEDIQDALKDLLSGTIQTMLETEMNEHLGYENYARDVEPNYRNGTKPKTARSKNGEFEVDVPQDRNSTFITDQEKVVSLFRFLKDLYQTNQVNNIRNYHWHLMLPLIY